MAKEPLRPAPLRSSTPLRRLHGDGLGEGAAPTRRETLRRALAPAWLCVPFLGCVRGCLTPPPGKQRGARALRL